MNETGRVMEQGEANRKQTHVIYALYAASILVGVTCLVAVIVNDVKPMPVA